MSVMALAALAVGAGCASPGSGGSAAGAASRSAAGGRVVDAAVVDRINATLSEFVESGKLAGVSALVYENGAEVYYNAFGLADRAAGVPMDRNTIVQIYSMTKPVTGVALMTLYEQGKFQLDDPVAKYAPEFANMKVYAGESASGAPVLEAPRREMTIRDLTRHTAGLATGGNNPGVGPLLQAADPMNRENTLTEMAAKLGRVPLWFHPGERWEYGLSVDVQ
ncbi:MAG TPA: serine hydrolase domain-containing protein, partial [Longimicrobiaceae bacterium]